MPRAFPLFGFEHLAILFLTASLPLLFASLARRTPVAADLIRFGLAAILGTNMIASIWLGCIWRNGFPLSQSLPMHMCDWALIATFAALLTKHQRAFELAYFWGLAGTFQGILTPDLRADLPFLRYLTFFIAHCGIVVSILFLIWGLRFRVQPGGALRAFAWTQVYVAIAAIVDYLTGGNYGYLRAKPAGASVLDYLGPWPWYLLWLEVVALGLFLLLSLPFYRPRAGS